MIVIAHKLSTVTAADNIVVLSDDGTVEDSGTHADLMAAGSRYADFSGATNCRQQESADGDARNYREGRDFRIG